MKHVSQRSAARAASVLAFALLAAAAIPNAALAAGDADHGEVLYQGCQDCHSLDKNDVGPRHRGVFGRKAGSLPDYKYSNALKNSDFVWDEQTLDKWLTNPQVFVPGSKMFYHLAQAQDRADVIEFLKERAK
jgi:cytochrome c